MQLVVVKDLVVVQAQLHGGDGGVAGDGDIIAAWRLVMKGRSCME